MIQHLELSINTAVVYVEHNSCAVVFDSYIGWFYYYYYFYFLRLGIEKRTARVQNFVTD